MGVEQTSLEGQSIAERYQLLRPLGQGGMGAVYLALDAEKEKEVAIKLISQPQEAQGKHNESYLRFQKRMQREVNVLMRVQDPRIVAFYDWGKDETHGLYYTMEVLLNSITLKEQLEAKPFSVRETLRLLQDILLGLKALHHSRVIHRDLKSTNILCFPGDDQLEIKLIDMGIARWFSEDLRTHVTVETEPGMLIGSPPYMPPEMWQGDVIDVRTDIYQTGIIAYEMLTNRLPFAGKPHQMMFQHLHSFLPDLTPYLLEKDPYIAPGFLKELNQLVQKATQKNPEGRFQDVESFYQEVASCLAFIDGSALPTASPVVGEEGREAKLSTAKLSEPTPAPSESADALSETLLKEKNELIEPTASFGGSLPLMLVGLLVAIAVFWGLWRLTGSGKSPVKPVSTHVKKAQTTKRKSPARLSQRAKKSTDIRPNKSVRMTKRSLPGKRPVVKRSTVVPRKRPVKRRPNNRRKKKDRTGLGVPGIGDTMVGH